jgi:hypothetical protein
LGLDETFSKVDALRLTRFPAMTFGGNTVADERRIIVELRKAGTRTKMQRSLAAIVLTRSASNNLQHVSNNNISAHLRRGEACIVMSGCSAISPEN